MIPRFRNIDFELVHRSRLPWLFGQVTDVVTDRLRPSEAGR